MTYRIAQDAGPSASELIAESNSQQRNDLLLAQIHALYSTNWFTSAGAIVTAMTFWVAYLAYTGDRHVLIWAAMVHLTQAVRILNGWLYQRDERAWQRMPVWRRRFMVGLLVSGLVWGSAPLFVLPTPDLATVCLMMLVMLGMGSGGIGVIVAYRPAIWAWLLPLLLPLPFFLLWFDAPLKSPLAVFSLAYLGVNLAFAFGQNALLVKALKAQFDNAELVTQLRHQMTLAAQADKEKSRFVASASHDLRQPMHALGLFASALEKRLAGTSEAPLVSNLNRCIESLDRSFNAMLDISKLDAGVVEPQLQSFPIRDVFRRLHMHFAGQAEGAGLHLRFKPGGKHVTSDPQLLERILSNLIQNAIKYTRDGGIVVVARNSGPNVNIEVWDTGIGIPESQHREVFREFHQLGNPERDRRKGLGLGLSIVDGLARAMGVEVGLDSREGRGSVFRLTLPISQAAVIASERASEEGGDLTGMNVLLVEDDESVLAAMSDLLMSWGCACETASSVDEALARLDAFTPHLLLVDYRLRDHRSGIEAVSLIRQQLGPDLPAFLVTGDTGPQRLREAHASGLVLLHKPVPAERLHAALLSQWRRAQGQAAGRASTAN